MGYNPEAGDVEPHFVESVKCAGDLVKQEKVVVFESSITTG